MNCMRVFLYVVCVCGCMCRAIVYRIKWNQPSGARILQCILKFSEIDKKLPKRKWFRIWNDAELLAKSTTSTTTKKTEKIARTNSIVIFMRKHNHVHLVGREDLFANFMFYSKCSELNGKDFNSSSSNITAQPFLMYQYCCVFFAQYSQNTLRAHTHIHACLRIVYLDWP